MGLNGWVGLDAIVNTYNPSFQGTDTTAHNFELDGINTSSNVFNSISVETRLMTSRQMEWLPRYNAKNVRMTQICAGCASLALVNARNDR